MFHWRDFTHPMSMTEERDNQNGENMPDCTNYRKDEEFELATGNNNNNNK